MLLSNVWCGECRQAVTIVDYHAELRRVVVLEGFCGTCGHKVARVIDDLASKKKTRSVASGLYIFDVRLYGDEHCTEGKKIIRRIQIPGSKSLYNFAKVIIDAFDFRFDHCFGFYSNFNRPQDSEKAYELFYDLDDVEPPAPHVKSVKHTKIQQVFKQPPDKMLFLFDYGDGWQFNVELKEIRKGDKGVTKTAVLESIGKAPVQYPPCEDEEENESK
jgi:hypothetical protein